MKKVKVLKGFLILSILVSCSDNMVPYTGIKSKVNTSANLNLNNIKTDVDTTVPILSSLSDDKGEVGDKITLNGKNFGSNPQVKISLGDVIANAYVIDSNDTTINIRVPFISNKTVSSGGTMRVVSNQKDSKGLLFTYNPVVITQSQKSFTSVINSLKIDKDDPDSSAQNMQKLVSKVFLESTNNQDFSRKIDIALAQSINSKKDIDDLVEINKKLSGYIASSESFINNSFSTKDSNFDDTACGKNTESIGEPQTSMIYVNGINTEYGFDITNQRIREVLGIKNQDDIFLPDARKLLDEADKCYIFTGFLKNLQVIQKFLDDNNIKNTKLMGVYNVSGVNLNLFSEWYSKLANSIEDSLKNNELEIKNLDEKYKNASYFEKANIIAENLVRKSIDNKYQNFSFVKDKIVEFDSYGLKILPKVESGLNYAVGMGTDIVESFSQYLCNSLEKIENDKTVPTIKNVMEEQILSGRKVILLPHSQGNFFVNEAIKEIKNSNDTNNLLKEYLNTSIGVIGLASPQILEKSFFSNSFYVSNIGDTVAQIAILPNDLQSLAQNCINTELSSEKLTENFFSCNYLLSFKLSNIFSKLSCTSNQVSLDPSYIDFVKVELPSFIRSVSIVGDLPVIRDLRAGTGILMYHPLESAYIGTIIDENSKNNNTTRLPAEGFIKKDIINLQNKLKAPSEKVLGQGKIQISLQWEGFGDIDLHVIEPGGRDVYFDNKNGYAGSLDQDNILGFGKTDFTSSSDSNYNKIEHYFACSEKNLIPQGYDEVTYNIKVNYYSRKYESGDVPYKLLIRTNVRQSEPFTGILKTPNPYGSGINVAKIKVKKCGDIYKYAVMKPNENTIVSCPSGANNNTQNTSSNSSLDNTSSNNQNINFSGGSTGGTGASGSW